MGVDPEPHRGHEPARIQATFRGEQHEPERDQAEEQRSLDPSGIDPDDDDRDHDEQPAQQRLRRAGQAPDEHADDGRRDPDEQEQTAGSPPSIGRAVQERREPTLHHPRLARGGERVRIGMRDVVRRPHEPPGGEVREEAVVVERAEPDQQRDEGDDPTDHRRQRGRLTKPRETFRTSCRC